MLSQRFFNCRIFLVMKKAKRSGEKSNKKILGFTLMEVLVGTTVFVLFALGVYEGVRFIYKVVYSSRLRIVETAILSELVETVRNMPYENVGTVGGVPAGTIEYERIFIRDGATYRVLTTVRNIDDPFDGTMTSTPQDTSPADYKLVEMSILCLNCMQGQPVILNSLIAPNGLENASYNGALFIRVFDSAGQPIPEADVEIINTSVDPYISTQDITDTQGYLKLIDTPTSTQNYEIIVSKEGYSSDYTVSTTPERTKPKKPHATVSERSITQSYFSIDLLSTMQVHTMSQSCSVAGNRLFNIWGDKLIGEDPPEPKYYDTFTTDANGDYTISNLEWDDYYFNANTSAYDVAGTIPMMPIGLEAGGSQEVTLILKAHTSNSLLVNVSDYATELPLSGVNVRIYSPTTSYDQSFSTGLGYSRQTDWSQGNGQELFINEDEYYDDDGNIEINSPAGDIKLKLFGSDYALSGWLESSTFDIGESVNFQNIVWQPLEQPTETGDNPVKLQLATSNSSSPASWDFLGPDGTSATYYTATNTLIYFGHDDDRYLRYRVYLGTDDSAFTPHLSDISFTYTNSCIPPGQSYFSSLLAQEFIFELSKSGYLTTTGTVDVSGYSTLWVPMVSD